MTEDINKGDGTTTPTEGPGTTVGGSTPSADVGGTPTVTFDPQQFVPIDLFRKTQSERDKDRAKLEKLEGQFDEAVKDALAGMPDEIRKQQQQVQLGFAKIHYAQQYNIPLEVMNEAKTPHEAAEIALRYVVAAKASASGQVINPPATGAGGTTVLDTIPAGGGGGPVSTPPKVSPASGAAPTGDALAEERKKLKGLTRGTPEYKAQYLKLKKLEQAPPAGRKSAQVL